jgi:hypothetical protein
VVVEQVVKELLELLEQLTLVVEVEQVEQHRVLVEQVVLVL